jgi:hypothetical protein
MIDVTVEYKPDGIIDSTNSTILEELDDPFFVLGIRFYGNVAHHRSL